MAQRIKRLEDGTCGQREQPGVVLLRFERRLHVMKWKWGLWWGQWRV